MEKNKYDQTGISTGLGKIIEKTFSKEIGDPLMAIFIPIVADNELLGPVLLKTILNIAGESEKSIEYAGKSTTRM